jgi:hypothetical protein
MSQTNAIILRIRADKADEFERMFRDEEVPIWRDFAHRGKLLAASLTRATYGTEEERWKKERIVEYILVAVLRDMTAHGEHDEDARFNAFLRKAKQLQPEEPLVWGGDTTTGERWPM